jgi:hypothetical protein
VHQSNKPSNKQSQFRIKEKNKLLNNWKSRRKSKNKIEKRSNRISLLRKRKFPIYLKINTIISAPITSPNSL